MIKHFNNEQSSYVRVDPVWPENPTETPTLLTARKPYRKLRVLVDAELLEATAAQGPLDKATLLSDLLYSEVVEFYRYTDGLLPEDIEPLDLSALTRQPPYPVYAGWAVAHPSEENPGHWEVIFNTDPTKVTYTRAGVRGNLTRLARADESQPVYQEFDPDERARRREMDALALGVAAQALHADVFITHRPYLLSGSGLVSKRGVTVCTVDEAIPLIALYLRAQREFILPTGNPTSTYRFDRGLYFWVGARELLPEAWRWFSACVQHSSTPGNEKLGPLGGSLLSRVTKALQERDEVHIALNQPANNNISDEALGSLDIVLVLLMGAVDACARVAHHVLGLAGSEYNAAWQKKAWRSEVAVKAPTLAAVVNPGTPGENTLTILRLLRNSVHGEALQGVAFHRLGSKVEMRIALPTDDEARILAALDATGGRESWGVNSLGSGMSLIRPGVLVDRLIVEVLSLLNSLMKETPMESLPDVAITPDNSAPPLGEPTFQSQTVWQYAGSWAFE